MSRFNYIELFAGIGGFRSALDALGGRCVFASEIDSFATRAYKALYNGAPELRGDITKIDARIIPDHDLLVGGFPCQAFSVAGQRKGFEDTRGTLFFEIARIAKVKHPKMMLLENVKGLLSHDKGRTIEVMAQTLSDIGYGIDFAVLNSKYFGVPQNRERIFIVAHRDMAHEPWNIEGKDVVARAKQRIQALGVRTFNFDWPTNNTVTKRLRDVLESEVDEKYYLSEEKTAKLIAQLEKNPNADRLPIEGESRLAGWRVRNDRVFAYQNDSKRSTAQEHIYLRGEAIADSITVGHMPKYIETVGDSDNCEMIGYVEGINGHDICRRVYSPIGIAPTVPTGTSGNTTPKIVELQQYSDGSGVAYTVDASYAKGTSPGDIGKGRRTHVIEEYTVIQKTHSTCTTVKHDETGTLQAARLDKVPRVVTRGKKRYRIRKLTPRECWRLQGFTDEQFDRAQSAGISDSQLYKQAGNAVTVTVISATSRRLIPMLLAASVRGNGQASEIQRLEAVV